MAYSGIQTRFLGIIAMFICTAMFLPMVAAGPKTVKGEVKNSETVKKDLPPAIIFINNHKYGPANGMITHLRKIEKVATCGHPGAVSEISWKWVKDTTSGSEYEFTRIFPVGQPDAKIQKITAEYTGSAVPVVIWRDDVQEISIRPERPDDFKNVAVWPFSESVAKEIRATIEALKADVVKLSQKYPQFTAAKDVPVTQKGWTFTRDYRDMGKGRYENTGPFPVDIGLHFMPIAEFNQKVHTHQMWGPNYRWDGLGMVGWVYLHTDDKTTNEVVTALQETISRAMRKIGSLNRQEFDARLPEDIKRQRSELLTKASDDICNGLHKLAEQFPQLKRGQGWNHLKPATEPADRIGIHLRRYHGWKAGTDENEVSKEEQFGILVVVKPQPDELEQLMMAPMYPALGLVGQVHANAGDPKLNTALNKLISDSLAPLAKLNARAAGTPSIP